MNGDATGQDGASGAYRRSSSAFVSLSTPADAAGVSASGATTPPPKRGSVVGGVAQHLRKTYSANSKVGKVKLQ